MLNALRLGVIRLSVIRLSVIRLCVIGLSIIRLSIIMHNDAQRKNKICDTQNDKIFLMNIAKFAHYAEPRYVLSVV